MPTLFVHTFLFACPECQLPFAITRVNEEKNLQSAGNQTMRGYCDYCGKVRYGSPATAKRHYVDEWERAKAANQA